MLHWIVSIFGQTAGVTNPNFNKTEIISAFKRKPRTMNFTATGPKMFLIWIDLQKL